MKLVPRELVDRYKSIKSETDLRKFLLDKPCKGASDTITYKYETDSGKGTIELSSDHLRVRLKQMYAHSFRLQPQTIKTLMRENVLEYEPAKAIYFHKINILSDVFIDTAFALIKSKGQENFQDNQLFYPETLPFLVFHDALEKTLESNIIDWVDVSKTFAPSFPVDSKIGRPKKEFDAKKRIIFFLFLFMDKLAKKENLKLEDMTSGKSELPNISATRFAKEAFPYSRKTLYNWLDRANTTFEECLEQVETTYVHSANKLQRIFSSEI